MKLLLNAVMAFGLATALHAQDTTGIAKTSESLLSFDPAKPLFKLKEEQLSNKAKMLRYNALTGYREGVEPIKGPYNSNFKSYADKVTGTRRIAMYNLSISDMFSHGIRNAATVVLEVKDPSLYCYEPSYGDEKAWLRKNGYCYELMMPEGVIKGMEIVDRDLERLFKVKSFVEKRMMKVQVRAEDGKLNEEMREIDVLIIRENNWK